MAEVGRVGGRVSSGKKGNEHQDSPVNYYRSSSGLHPHINYHPVSKHRSTPPQSPSQPHECRPTSRPLPAGPPPPSRPPAASPTSWPSTGQRYSQFIKECRRGAQSNWRQYTRPMTHHDTCGHFDDTAVKPLECGGHTSENCCSGIIGCGLHWKVEGQAEGDKTGHQQVRRIGCS